MNYNYYRDYNPAIGRYVESDPIGLKSGVNTFAYTFDNPVHFGDPWGLSAADVQRIFQYSQNWTNQQTAAGKRIDPGWKNDACAYGQYVGACSQSYDGCGPQALGLQNTLEDAQADHTLHLDDHWDFDVNYRYIPTHFWVDATSCNSAAP